MMERRLREQLGSLEQMLRRTRLWRGLALCWIAAACLGIVLLLLRGRTGWNPTLFWILPLLGAIAAALVSGRT